MTKADQKSIAYKRWMMCISVFHLDVACRIVQELSRMALANFVTFVVLKILNNLVSIQSSLNASNC